MKPKKINRFLKLASKLAIEHEYDPGLEFFICSVIVRGGKVLSIGYNHRGNHPLIDYYRTNDYTCTVHAEIDAIVNARKKIRLEGAKMYNVRVRTDGSTGNARPCQMCSHVLFNYGIKKVIFTEDENTIGIMKVINPAKVV